MASATKKNIDMINGPLLKKLIVFSVPLILSGVLQLLFNAADVVVVGQFAGTESFAAVGSTGSLVNLITNLTDRACSRSNVVMARAIRRANREKAGRIVTYFRHHRRRGRHYSGNCRLLFVGRFLKTYEYRPRSYRQSYAIS